MDASAVTFAAFRAAATVKAGTSHTWPGELGRMSVTREDGDFLYALVRVTRPERVVELGTGLGVAARFIGQALWDNGGGWLTTFEPRKEYADQARTMLGDLPVTVEKGSGENFDLDADLVFVDSGGLRGDVIRQVLERGDGALVVVHDAMRQYDECGLYGVGVLVPGQDGFWIGRGK